MSEYVDRNGCGRGSLFYCSLEQRLRKVKNTRLTHTRKEEEKTKNWRRRRQRRRRRRRRRKRKGEDEGKYKELT